MNNEQSENLIEIRYNVYLCKTQAGFRKLIKKVFVDDYHTFKEITDELTDYPKKYPAIVIPNHCLFFESGHPECYIVYTEDFVKNC